MVFSCSSRAPVAPGEDLPGALAGRPPFPVATSVVTSVVSRTSLWRTPWCLRTPLASDLPGALAGRPPFPVATSVATSVVSRTSLCRTPWCLRIPLASGLSPVGDDVCVRSLSSRPPRQALILRHICRLPTDPVRAAARCPLHFCFVARLAGARLLEASGVRRPCRPVTQAAAAAPVYVPRLFAPAVPTRSSPPPFKPPPSPPVLRCGASLG